MRVLFIRPKIGLSIESGPQVPLGILALASFLQSRGHTVRIFDHMLEGDLAKAVVEFQPDAAAVTLPSACTIPDAMQVSRILKALGLPVFWGGTMASAIPELVARSGCADYVGISEGEYTLLELLEVLEGKRGPETVRGIAYVDENGAYHQTADRPFADLADFPPLDYSLVPVERFCFSARYADRAFLMTASKGCPFSCTFCFNREYHRCQRRMYPLEVLLRQIKTLTQDYDVTGLSFYDDAFGADKRELRAFCQGIKDLKPGLTWAAVTGIGVMSHEDIEIIHDAGCRMLVFGLESGSAEMRKRLHKHYDASKAAEIFRSCREAGIQTWSMFIIGLPDETPEQLRETVRFFYSTKPDKIRMNFFSPIPGTQLFRELATAGRLVPEKTLEDMERSAMERQTLGKNYSCVPDRDLLVIMNYFNLRMVLEKKRQPADVKPAVTVKTAFDNLRCILRSEGLRGLARAIWDLAKLFCTVVWYACAYPSIRKKYGLHTRNCGRTEWSDP